MRKINTGSKICHSVPLHTHSEDYDDEVLDIKILIRLLRSLQVFESPRNSKENTGGIINGGAANPWLIRPLYLILQ